MKLISKREEGEERCLEKLTRISKLIDEERKPEKINKHLFWVTGESGRRLRQVSGSEG